VLAAHRLQLRQYESHGTVKPHDHCGQHLHIVAHRAHLVAHSAMFVEDARLLAGQEFEHDWFVCHGRNVVCSHA
jgi:hypothetical protein